MYTKAESWEMALEAYLSGSEWQLALCMAAKLQYKSEQMISLANKITGIYVSQNLNSSQNGRLLTIWTFVCNFWYDWLILSRILALWFFFLYYYYYYYYYIINVLEEDLCCWLASDEVIHGFATIVVQNYFSFFQDKQSDWLRHSVSANQIACLGIQLENDMGNLGTTITACDVHFHFRWLEIKT